MDTLFVNSDTASTIDLFEQIAKGSDPLEIVKNSFGSREDLKAYAESQGIFAARSTYRMAFSEKGARHFVETLIANKILMLGQLPPSAEQFLIFFLYFAIEIRNKSYKRHMGRNADEEGIYRSIGFTRDLAEETGQPLITIQAIFAVLRAELVVAINENQKLREMFFDKAKLYIESFRLSTSAEEQHIPDNLEEFIKNQDVVGFYRYATGDKRALHSWYMEELDLLSHYRNNMKMQLSTFMKEFLEVLVKSGEDRKNAITEFRNKTVEKTGVSIRHQRSLNALQNLMIYSHPVRHWEAQVEEA